MKRILIAATALALLAGCSGRQAALDARIRQLTEERDKDAGIAQHLDEVKQQRQRELDDLAKLGVWEPDADAKSVLLAASGAAGRCASAGYRKEGATPVVTLTGSGSPEEAVACLDRFASAQRMMVLRSLSIGDHEWTADLVLRGGPPIVDEPPEPTPAPALFELPATRSKRVRIAELEQQIAEYDRLLGDVKDDGALAAKLQMGLELLAGEPDRLEHARVFWNAGWAGVDAPLASGTMTFADGKATLHGPLRGGVDAAKLADIASKRHLEIALLDGSGATLTGTYSPPKGP